MGSFAISSPRAKFVDISAEKVKVDPSTEVAMWTASGQVSRDLILSASDLSVVRGESCGGGSIDEVKHIFSFLACPTKARCCKKIFVRCPSAPDTIAEAVVGGGTCKALDTNDKIWAY